MGDLEIRRKVNDQDWEFLITKVGTPYIDEEPFPAGTNLSYSILLEEDAQQKRFSLEVRL